VRELRDSRPDEDEPSYKSREPDAHEEDFQSRFSGWSGIPLLLARSSSA
jgi:hypothetical protein